MAIEFIGERPPDKALRNDVVRVTTTENRTFCVFSKNPYGVFIHWHGGRSNECRAQSGGCALCDAGVGKKFLTYLYVQEIGCSEPAFLELTATAVKLLLAQVPEAVNLRGMYIRIHKSKGGPKGRYRVEVLERRAADDCCLPEKDPMITLRYLWRCKNSSVRRGSETL